MIEPTDEMIAAFESEGTGGWGDITDTRAGLAAVLAIVERDYERRRCDDPSWAGHRCTKPLGHPDSHYHRFSGVTWP